MDLTDLFVTPKDSRQRYTKQCLFDAFEKALAEHPVSEISVSEICKEAGVSRKTFYKYYSDPFALLLAMQDDLFVGFGQELAELPHDVFTIVPALIRFSGEHRVVMRAAFANRSEGNVVDRTINWIYQTYHEDWKRANPDLTEEEVRFLFQFVVSGIAGLVQLWLTEYPSTPADEVCARANTFMRLSSPA